MTEGNDAFERNLERLIRGAAPPPPDAGRVRREFLARVEGKSPSHVRLGRMIAMAASLLAVAAILYGALAPKTPVKPAEPALVQDAPAAPSAVRNETTPVEAAPAKAVRPESAPGPATRTMIAKDGATTLSCAPPSRWTLSSKLKFEGTAPLPERTNLNVAVIRMHETHSGGRLIAQGDELGGDFGQAQISSKRFQVQNRILWKGPGRYIATVKLSGDQTDEVRTALKKISWTSSTFEFDGWGDELVGQLGPKLQDLDALVRDCVDMIAKIEKLAANESSWVKERKKIDERHDEVILTKEAEEAVKETDRLIARLKESEAKVLLPAAHGELFLTLTNLNGSARHFTYVKGKFTGATTYHGNVKTHRGDELSFDAVKKILGETSALAGREAALWIVKDLKRTDANQRQALADALKSFGQHPGIASVSDRLVKAAAGDLDALEEEIRAGK